MSAILDQRLAVRPDTGGFTHAEVAGCDEPVRRYFCSAIAPGTPLAQAALLRMRGSIRFGSRWIPFLADEQLAPLHGYHWRATIAGGVLRGADVLVDGDASMLWRALGLLPIIRARGPDVSRSAMGRVVAESIWLPTALLPRYGVDWRAEDDEHLVAEVPIRGERVTLHITIGAEGEVLADHLDRWHGPDGNGSSAWAPFGVEATASRAFPCGITIPAEGVGGWFHDTPRWDEGRFMRYAVLDLTLI